MTFRIDTERTIEKNLRLEMFGLRKRVFCDQLDWDIPHSDGFEADIYDFHGCYYLNWIHSDTDTLLGSARLMPMVQDNLLTTVFKNSMHGDCGHIMRQNRKTWECTRLCLEDDAFTTIEKRVATIEILMAIFAGCHMIGIETLLCNCNAAIQRLYRTFGLELEYLGHTQKFHQGTIKCLSIAISNKSYQALDALSQEHGLSWPKIDGDGLLMAQSFVADTDTEFSGESLTRPILTIGWPHALPVAKRSALMTDNVCVMPFGAAASADMVPHPFMAS